MAGHTWLKYLDSFEQDMVRALKRLGYDAMMDAYAKRGFRHRTRNLHDSYASAVYVNGVLVKSSVKYIGNPLSREKDHLTGKNGRQTVKDYLGRISPGCKNGEIVLVVVAAMYYAGILESSWNPGKRRKRKGEKEEDRKDRRPTGNQLRIIVISPARQYIDKHYMEYVGAVYKKYGIKDKPKAIVIKGENIL